jgi:flavin-dependent dehydrogenase
MMHSRNSTRLEIGYRAAFGLLGMKQAKTRDVAVIGGGPAGIVAARGLAALGHHVVVLAHPRRHYAIEGVSERTANALRLAGCEKALGVLGPPRPRFSSWNGAMTESGVEHLVERNRLDEALRADAEQAGVQVVDARCDGWEEGERGCRVTARHTTGEALVAEAGFVVEARGRAAPLDRASAARGPATTALSRSWTPSGSLRGSALASFERGWCWVAAPLAGPLHVQLVVSSGSDELLSRRGIEGFYESLLRNIPEPRRWLDGASPCSTVRARDATPILGGPLVSPRSLRVGDAAFAVDPLSGQGLFEAVATALAAAPVVNTLLRRPDDCGLAEDFYRLRVTDTFLRLARAGRDSYRAERRWSDSAFWRERRAWPDDAPTHGRTGPASVETVAVSERGYIVSRSAVVTPDHPRGVWRLDDVELVPLLEFARANRSEADRDLAAVYAERVGVPRTSVDRALSWLRRRGLI